MAIIFTADGSSRPSFMIRHGIPEINGSYKTEWNADLHPCSSALRQAIAATGCINYSKQQAGTGFLIANNLIITNRHVLQQVAKERDGNWIIYNNVNIDFGFEDEARSSYLPRKFKKVIYAGPETNGIDHTKDDIALIEIDGETDLKLQQPMALSLKNTLQTGSKIFVIGYPAKPETEILGAASLFNNIYNVKRISPGMVVTDANPEYKGRICHDATTLTGNSGSLIVVLGNESAAAAIHYGGLDNVNWSHSLSHFCKPDSVPCLTTYFDTYGVKYL